MTIKTLLSTNLLFSKGNWFVQFLAKNRGNTFFIYILVTYILQTFNSNLPNNKNRIPARRRNSIVSRHRATKESRHYILHKAHPSISVVLNFFQETLSINNNNKSITWYNIFPRPLILIPNTDHYSVYDIIFSNFQGSIIISKSLFYNKIRRLEK